MKNLLYTFGKHAVVSLAALCVNAACAGSDDNSLPPEAEVRAEVRLVSHFALNGYKAVFLYSETRAVTDPISIEVDPAKPNEGVCRLPLLSNRLVISSVTLTNDQTQQHYTIDLPKGQRIDKQISINAHNKKAEFYCTPGKLRQQLRSAGFSEKATEISIGGTLDITDFETLKNAYYRLETIVLVDQTTLSAHAFAMSSLKKLVAPQAIYVGESCFDGAEQFKTIEAPQMQLVEGNAFRGTAIVELSFPQLVKAESAAFCDMPLLRNIDFPLLQVLRTNVFAGCQNLNGVKLPRVAEIQRGAFYGCSSLQNLNFPETIAVEMMAFQECLSLRSLSLNKLITIPEQMCLRCEDLQSVSAVNATVISKLAFSECRALSSINFPEALFIGSNAFTQCTSLTSVTLPKVSFCDENGSQFSGCSALSSVSMPALQRIEKFAFSGCSSLSQVDLPAAKVVERYAFSDCSSIEELVLPSLEAVNMGFNSMPALKRLDLPVAYQFRADCFVGSDSLCELRLGTTWQMSINGSGLVFAHVANSANCDLYLDGNNYSEAKLTTRFWQETTWKSINRYR